MNKKRFISPALFALILICFSLPFVTVSCSGYEVTKITGFQMITGTEVEGEKINPNPLAIIAFVAGVGGLIIGFWSSRKANVVSAVMGAVGFICTLLVRLLITQKVSSEGEGMLSVEYGSGFYLPLILFLVAAGYNIADAMDNKKSLAIPGQSPPKGPNVKFCSQCGSKAEAEQQFCSECGARF
ncbi:hypothetical protein G7K71_09395 [Desulfofundulus sp. TPOSR]|uniref:zinc-ribbon domain-containing protein n=1 Tax=Desulfofundulus sp. TPOSR TaxID=2714340 RepID=UPI001409D9C5|nr:zinc ribbon domain-containing protein [Desulfofundulus sp. TPOSR]NHM27195.1 hypothetical protein [Desulfofundulus sp. TPOSR]